VPYQKMIFFGEKKKLEIEIPFNAPHDRTTNIFIDEGGLPPGNPQQITFEACDQYAIQAERFSQAIIDDTDVPVSLENAYGNTAVIEAIFQSAEKGRWINI
jgi:predicted dehydrogenase